MHFRSGMDRQAGTTAPGMGMVSTITSTSVTSPVTAIIRVRVSRSARSAMAMARRLILFFPYSPKRAARRCETGASRICKNVEASAAKAQAQICPDDVIIFIPYYSIIYVVWRASGTLIFASKAKFLFDAVRRLQTDLASMSARSNAAARRTRGPENARDCRLQHDLR
ncbi:MAG: hypothetical protein HLUCCA04_05640 [Oceanicaulis sp. HLUCCA04]|nr:MAG: hypothetical protein HLUCCA04_05640 [Oceanicaulis sp. HLUCCA04]